MSLRKKIIRLAHQKPELRKHLLPLVVNSKTAMDKENIREILDYLNSEIGDTLYDGNGIEFKKAFSSRGDNYLLLSSPLLSFVEDHPYVQEMADLGTGSYSAYSNNYGSRVKIEDVKDYIADAVDGYSSDIDHLVKFDDINIKGSKRPDEQGYIWATVEIILKVVS